MNGFTIKTKEEIGIMAEECRRLGEILAAILHSLQYRLKVMSY